MQSQYVIMISSIFIKVEILNKEIEELNLLIKYRINGIILIFREKEEVISAFNEELAILEENLKNENYEGEELLETKNELENIKLECENIEMKKQEVDHKLVQTSKEIEKTK